jgi:hypothetical protein
MSYEHESDSQRLRSCGEKTNDDLDDTKDLVTDVLPAWRGTPHYSRHVTEFLNDRLPYRWIGRGSLQNWPLRSPDLTPQGLHEKHGAWT